MNNLKFFRDLSGITPKQFSKLLNTSAHSYIGMEQEKIKIPAELVIMIAKLYSIDPSDIFKPHSELSDKTLEKVREYSSMDENERFVALCSNLTEGQLTRVTYRDVRKLKDEILESIRSQEK